MSKSVVLSEEVWERLMRLKLDKGLQSMDEVVQSLLEGTKKTSKVLSHEDAKSSGGQLIQTQGPDHQGILRRSRLTAHPHRRVNEVIESDYFQSTCEIAIRTTQVNSNVEAEREDTEETTEALEAAILLELERESEEAEA